MRRRLVLLLAIAAGTQMTVSNRCQQAFGSISHANYPLTHWLMMGSHGKGVYNEADDKFTLTLPDDKKGPVTKAENHRTLSAFGRKGNSEAVAQKDGDYMGRRLVSNEPPTQSDGGIQLDISAFDWRKKLCNQVLQPVLLAVCAAADYMQSDAPVRPPHGLDV